MDEELGILPDIVSLPANSWEDYLARLAPADAEACRRTVDEVVGAVSRAARAIHEIQPAASVLASLLEAQAGLARLHTQLWSESVG